MTYRVVRLPVYALVVLVAVTLVSPVLSIVASVTIAEAATKRQVAAADRQAAAIREEQRVRACSVYGALIGELTENPPQGSAGKALLAEYKRQYKIRSCTPAR